jgi:peptidoglycan/xylan/chitin deacetylase (PgdA/CDA1 family)
MTAIFGPGDFSGDGNASVDCSRLACVALTFDDGPSAYTNLLIDRLTALDVPATFFVVGSQVVNRPATALRLQRSGFAVENHTYSHPQLNLLSLSAQRSEVERCDNALAAAGVARSTLLRPPYGSWNSNTRLLGKPLILWSVDPRDWDGRTSSQIRSHVVANTTAGDIVLMHDRVSATVDAVPGIVSDLRARGFTLVTVETLVPWMEPGDLVYSRGRVLQASTAALAPESVPLLVDEAPFLPDE